MKFLLPVIALILSIFTHSAQAATTYKCINPSGGIAVYKAKSSFCVWELASWEEGTDEPKPTYPGYKCWANSGKGTIYYSSKNVSGCLAYILPKTLVTKQVFASDKLVTDQVFAPTSFWYQPIPSNVKLADNTTALQADFVGQVKKYSGSVATHVYHFSAPVFVASADEKTQAVAFYKCQAKYGPDARFIKMMSAVPIPANAVQASGTDGEMTIYQPSTDSLWDMWKASKRPDGTWQACWGGKIENVSKSNGVFPDNYGTTATSLPFVGGQVTAEELKRGEIKHAIGISLVNTTHWNVYSWPANRSDGYNPTNEPNRIAEGQRFRLDPSVDVDQLKMSKAGKTIAKAAQKYGFIVWDRAGTVSIRAQAPQSYATDPYPELLEGRPQYAVLDGFPWDKLQFLPMHYGKP